MSKSIQSTALRLAAVFALLALLVGAFALAGCGSDGESGGESEVGEIVLGVDASMSGPLAGFGAYQKWAIETAVAEQNAKGGITVDGEKVKIKVVLLDDKSDANVAASNVDTLITKDKAVAIIGPVTPTVGNAAALAAERLKTPYLETGNPIEPFMAVKDQWTYAYDFFISAAQTGDALFTWPADLGVQEQTNSLAAFVVDNSADGPVFLDLWKAFAPEHGWKYEVMPAYPQNSTEFGNLIGDLKASGADWVVVLGDTPALVAMRKQMDAVGYKPKMMEMERGGQLQQFGDALGPLADGVTVNSYWLPSLPYPGAKELGEKFLAENPNLTMGQILGPEYAAAQIMMAAIEAAGTTDPDAIAEALGATDTMTVAGPVKFDEKHTSMIESFWTQWQNNATVIVWPEDIAEAELIFPLP